MYWKGAVMRSIIEFTRLNEFAVIFITFVLAFALVDFVVEPVQHYFLSSSVIAGSLLFIPHGIRVLAVWLCGVRAILPLICAELFSCIFLWKPDIGLDVFLGSAMVGGLCEQVPNPVAVRYAWADNPVANVYSREGLPLTPFRSDNWDN